MKTWLPNYLRELKYSLTWVSIGWPAVYGFFLFAGTYIALSRVYQYIGEPAVPAIINLIILKVKVPLASYGFTFDTWFQVWSLFIVLQALAITGWFISRNKAAKEGTLAPTGFAMFWASHICTFILLMFFQVA